MKQAHVRVKLVAFIFAGFAAALTTSASEFGTRKAKASDVIGILDLDSEKRKLFARCTPVGLGVENLGKEEAKKIGLTKEAVVNAVESRLRAARLFETEILGSQYLYVNVNLVGNSFNVQTQLDRFLDDTGYGYSGVVTVWNVGLTGTHGAIGQYVLGVVSEHIDEFLTKYLSANEKACAAK